MLTVNLDMMSLFVPVSELKKTLFDKKYLNVSTVEDILKTAFLSDDLMENEKAVKVAVTFRSIYTNEVLIRNEGKKINCVFIKDIEKEVNTLYDTFLYVKEIFEENFENVYELGKKTDIQFINIINTNDSIFLYYHILIKDEALEDFKSNALKSSFIPISTFNNLTNLSDLTKIVLSTLKIVERGDNNAK